MSKRIRCRCPLCGMLVTQKQLDGEYEFEFKIQEILSKGRGKIYNVYREPNSVEGEAFLIFKLSLVQKLRDVAERLYDSLQSGRKGKEQGPVEVDAEYEEIIPPILVAPFTKYVALAETEIIPEAMTDIVPQTRMEGGKAWQGSADLEVETQVELKAKTILED